MTGKDYFTIGEVSRKTGIPEYTLRYWESRFRLLRPVRRESGHRRFTKKDIETILAIKDLVFRRNFTLAGAKKMLRTCERNPNETVLQEAMSGDRLAPGDAWGQGAGEAAKILREIRKELLTIIKE